jgi:hypothetical protein
VSVQLQTQPTTRIFARILGPYLVISMAIHLMRRDDVPAMVAALESNALVPWVSGGFALLTGLVVLGLLEEWRSPSALVIGAIGALTALEGVSLMAAPAAYGRVAESIPFVASAVVMGLVGVYLTYVGWRSSD